MPKRDATSELNHDNWDKEDESEEAGEFKKASEDQMKVCIQISKVHFVSLLQSIPHYKGHRMSPLRLKEKKIIL